MSKSADISPWVDLYRALGCPSLDANLRLNLSRDFTTELVDRFIEVHNSLKLHPLYGSGEVSPTSSPMECFKIGHDDLNPTNFRSKLSDNNGTIELSFPQNHEIRFHQNANNLVTTLGKSNKVELPEFYYLVDEDYYHSKDDLAKRPPQLQSIDSVVGFASKLESLANSVDDRGGTRRAIFYVTDADKKGHIRPVSIELKITPDLLNLPKSSFVILDAAAHADSSNPHEYEKRLILKSALHEVMIRHDGHDNIIKHLFENWEEVDKIYHQHLETFIEGISFNKLRHEVEERGLSFLNDLNNSLSEISLKLTALPASFGVWVYFARGDQELIRMLGFFLAILMMTLLLHNSLKGLFNRLDYIEGLIERQISLFSQKSNASYIEVENSKLGSDIKSLDKSLSIRVSEVRDNLTVYRCVLWFPVLIMLIVIIYQHSLSALTQFAINIASCFPLPS